VANRSIKIEILGDAKGARTAFGDAERSAEGFGSKIAGIGKAAVIATGAIAAAAGGLALDGLNQFSKFQSGMNEVFTLIPGAGKAMFDTLSGGAKQFSKDFGVLPDQVVPALYQSLSAGVPPDNVFAFLEIAQKAAKGGVTDLTTSVNGITSVVNAYGEEVVNAAKASDLMFTAVRLGKTDFSQLSASLFNVIPTAASLGVEFGDVTAALARLTAQGTPTSVATTQLRAAFQEAAKDGGKLDQALKQLHGKSFPDLVAGGMDIGSIFDSLRSSMPDEEFRGLFGSVEALQAVLGITGPQAEAFQQALAEMGNSAGATDQAFQTMDRGIGPVLAKLRANLAVARIELGERLAPYAERFLNFVLTTGVPAVTALASRLGGPLMAGLRGAANIVTGQVMPAVSSLLDFVGRLREAFAEGGLTGALGAFVGTVTGLFDRIDWGGIAGSVVSGLSGALSRVSGLAAGIGSWFVGAVTGVDWGGVATGVKNGLITALRKLRDWGGDVVSWVADTVSGVEWSAVGTVIKDGVVGAFTAITNWGSRVVTWVADTIAGVDWRNVGSTIKEGVVSAFTAITDWGGRVVDWVTNAVSAVDWGGAATAIRDKIVEAASSVDWSALGAAISSGFDSLVESNATIAGFIEKLIGIREQGQPLIDLITGSLLSTLDSLRTTWDNVKASLEGVDWAPILQALQTLGIVVGAVLVAAVVGFLKMLETLAQVLSVALPAAVTIAVGALNIVAVTINTTRTVIEQFVRIVRALIDGDWSMAWAAARTLVSSFAGGVQSILNIMASTIFSIIDTLTGGALTRFNTWATNTRNSAASLAAGVLEAIRSLPGDVAGIVADLASGALRLLDGLVTDAVIKATTLYTDVLRWFRDLATDAPARIGELARDALLGLAGFVGDAVTTVSGLPDKVSAVLGDLSGVLYGKGKQFVQGLIDGILDMLGPLGDAIGRVGDVLGRIDVPGFSPPDEAGLHMGQLFAGNLAKGIDEERRRASGAVARLGRELAAVNLGAQVNLGAPGRGSVLDRLLSAGPVIQQHITLHVEDRSPAAIANAVTLAGLQLGRELAKEGLA
jgi:TP901 family phage tail tape measure protein